MYFLTGGYAAASIHFQSARMKKAGSKKTTQIKSAGLRLREYHNRKPGEELLHSGIFDTLGKEKLLLFPSMVDGKQKCLASDLISEGSSRCDFMFVLF
ncbi:hypothetical protein [Gimesia panareensis]|uniref:hypothetical protein n=1 Tax=Gimesia panareensis TaxID=2527978 RepID=UPI0018D96770|nr:hypothetical protein [Gimesia panareensis]